MPLDVTKLYDGLLDVASAPGPTNADCATQWADAMKEYASAVVPASTTVEAAADALETALAAAFALPAAAASMESAFAAFALAVGGGMAPAFTATPPPGPVGFATQFASAFPATHALAATALSGLINTWMKTGTATPTAGGAPVNWS